MNKKLDTITAFKVELSHFGQLFALSGSDLL